MGGKHGHWCPLTDCTMWSHIVVVTPPKFDLRSGVVKIQEPMLVEAFQTDAGIEAFDEGIIRHDDGGASFPRSPRMTMLR